MIPIIYDKFEEKFTSNGKGRLTDCTSCIVTEERNGIYECEFQYPITGKFYDDLRNGAIIGVIHDDNHDIQPFDVYSYTAPTNGLVTFYAHHISYRLNNIVLQPFNATSCAQTIANIVPNSINRNPFTFWTDKNVNTNFGLSHPESVRAILFGQEGSILDVYGKGEYEFDKWDVRLYTNRGSDTGVTVRYGKNLVSINDNVDKSTVCSAIAPYWIGADNVVVYLPEIYVVSPSAPTVLTPWTEQNDIEMTDGSEVIYFQPAEVIPTPVDFSPDFTGEPTAAQLRTRAYQYLSENTPWIPNENLTIDFAALWQTPEYENVAVLQRVGLCDTVSVYYPELGVTDTNAKVIKVVYNVLLERFDSMEFGKLKSTLTQDIEQGVGDQIYNEVRSQVSHMDAVMIAAIEHATKEITGGLGGYVVMTMNADNQPQELLIMDTPDTSTAVNVWRFNRGGLGHSHSGYNGPYNDVALTQDGKINAAMITTGIMNATLIRAGVIQDLTGTNYWNLETGEFQLAATTQVGTSTIASQADIAGTVVAADVEYGNSSSSSTPPSTWTTNASWEQGKYLWTRIKMTLEDGSTAYSDARMIAGTNGLGVASVVEQYYLSTSNSSQTGGSWSDTQQTWVSGRYYWTRSKITWSDGTTTYTTATLAKALTTGNQSTDDLDTSLNQQAIFNRLTNNGQTQGIYLNNGLLYINATYIQSGTLSANYIKGGTLEVGGLNDTNGVVAVYSDAGVLNSRLSKYGIESFATTHSSTWNVDLTYYSRLIGSVFYMYTQVEGNAYNQLLEVKPGFASQTQSHLRISVGGGTTVQVVDDPLEYFSWGAGFYDNPLFNRYRFFRQDLFVDKNIVCNGTKSRTVQTDEFGRRLLYCYETPSPLFGDVGEGVIDETGVCYVFLDPVFAETVTTNQYQVFLQRYGQGDCFVSERRPDHFVVTGPPGLAFGWELKAKQKGFEQLRLEQESGNNPQTHNYGEDAATFLENLEEGRIA